jgi:hypothetical protein
MEWFKHDANANLDEKLQEVLLDYGLEGYGLYWYCIELIVGKVSADNITFELKHDARVIARNTGSTVQKVEEMMKRFVDVGLFENQDGSITCLKVAKRLMTSATSNPQMRNLIQNIKQNQTVTESSCHRHDGIMQEENRIEEIRTDKKKPSPGEVCLAIKKNGIIDVSPSHPTLLKLIEAGATVDNFVDAAKVCNVKKFAYLLKVIETQLKNASELNIKSATINKAKPYKHDTMAAAQSIFKNSSGISYFENKEIEVKYEE